MTRTSPARSRALAGAAAAIALVFAGCDSDSADRSSESAPSVAARAVDGFIVGASVVCDEASAGGTSAGGRLICPFGSVLARVNGGMDVGFDETATVGGVPFVGELVGPLVIGWVTPLSTVAVAMATEDGSFDPLRFSPAVDALASVLGQSGLDLSADPSTTVQLVKLNAQIHQVLSAFGTTEDDYRETSVALAALIADSAATGATFALGDETGVLIEALNRRFVATGSRLARTPDELTDTIVAVQEVNGGIDGASTPDRVFEATVAAPVAGQALTIERDDVLLTFDGDGAVRDFTQESFESDELGDGATSLGYFFEEDGDRVPKTYQTVIDGSGRLSLSADAFEVDRDIDGRALSIGFALNATDAGDARSIAVTTTDARVTARAGDSDSIAITLPAGSVLDVRSVSATGTVTTASIRLETAHEFVSGNGGVELSFWRIDRELERRGFSDLTAEIGNYRMTVAIAGVRINQRENGEMTRTDVLTVDAGRTVVSGSGFEGYVTIVPSRSRLAF